MISHRSLLLSTTVLNDRLNGYTYVYNKYITTEPTYITYVLNSILMGIQQGYMVDSL